MEAKKEKELNFRYEEVSLLAQCKESAKVGDTDLTPDPGRSLRDENGNPFQYSCLENAMDRGAWRAIVHGVTKSQTQLKD